MIFIRKSQIYFSILFFISLIILSPNATGMNIYWFIPSGQEIDPGETIIVYTEVLNDNPYKINITLSIFGNESFIINESAIYVDPSGWYAKLNETNFIMDPGELRNVSLEITAPQTAVNNQVYNIFLMFYAEIYTFPYRNLTNDNYGSSTIIQFEEKNDIQDNLNNNNISNISNDNPKIPEPNINNTTKRNDNFKLLYLETAIIIFIVIITIIFYAIYKKKSQKKRFN